MRVHTLAACVAALFLAACVFGHTVALRLLLLAAGIVLTSIVLAKNRESMSALPPIWLLFAVWAGWTALSLAWSFEPERTLKEWRNEVFYTGAGLWICFVGAQARHAVRIFGPFIIAAMVVACAIALGDFTYGFDIYGLGWHGGPGDHSSALVTLMPCAVMAGWYANHARWPLRGRLALWGLVALMALGAYTTHNRMIWVAFAAQFVLIGILLGLRSPASTSPQVPRRLAVILAIAAAVISGTIIFKIQLEKEYIGATFVHRDTRFALWPEIVERIEQRPLTGYGFGRGLLRDSLQHQFQHIDRNLWHAHNIILEALLQVGAPGALLLLLLFGAIVREGWRLARAPDEFSAACGIALIAVVGGIFARNMTDTLLVRQNALLFWGVVGVLLAWGAKSWRASS